MLLFAFTWITRLGYAERSICIRLFGGMGTFAAMGTGTICTASESVHEGIEIKLAKIVEIVPTELEEFTIQCETKDHTYDRSLYNVINTASSNVRDVA